MNKHQTDRNRHAFRIGHYASLCVGSCKEHIIGKRTAWRKREPLRARLRDTHKGKETEMKHKREGETQRGKDREVSSTPDRSNKEVFPKQQDRHEKNGLAPLRCARTAVGRSQRRP